MEKYKLSLNNLSQQNNFIKIPIGQNFSPMDNSEIAENQFLETAIDESINPIIDYEKVRFYPFNDINEIIIKLHNSGSTPLYYGDTIPASPFNLGYSNDDVKFRRNRFKNSFIKFNFYDSPNPSDKRLVFQQIIYNQLNDDQRDINGNLLSVSAMPITYRLVDPITFRKGISEGYYIYWLKNPSTPYPKKFYMTATYNNAADGIITPLMAYDATDGTVNPLTGEIVNPFAPILPINLYNSYNSVKYLLSSINNNNIYAITSLNSSTGNNYRTINVTGNTLTITLYPIRIA
jgi:hypothetical protein